MAGELNQTPSANRIHIGFFGRRNAGKSSLVNAVTGQNLSIVSDVQGTTTDPVSKAMELLPLGPVVIIDTPGIDDEGELGQLRVKRSYQMLNKTDVAVLVVDGTIGMLPEDEALLARIREKKIPYLIAVTKSDLTENGTSAGEGKSETAESICGKKVVITEETEDLDILPVSAVTGENIHELKERIAARAKGLENERRLISDLLSPGNVVILVTPIDGSAPKGRMILPQVQVIRDILDVHAAPLVTQPEELPAMLSSLKEPPFAVVTDSQAFGKVMRMVPPEVPLTSFSILMARYKGILETAARGAASVRNLKDGDTILISEGCTHHRQCEDIGTVKLPGWIRKYVLEHREKRTDVTHDKPESSEMFHFAFTSGTEFPEDLSPYALVVHCGGCMLNEREMLYRMKCTTDQGVPFTNYGTLIAYMNGILERSLTLFPGMLPL